MLFQLLQSFLNHILFPNTFVFALTFVTVSFMHLPVQLLIPLSSLSLIFLSHETFLVKKYIKLSLRHEQHAVKIKSLSPVLNYVNL